MKKVLFHLSISLITFIFGISSANFLFSEKVKSPSIATEKIDSVDVQESQPDISSETKTYNNYDEYIRGWYALKNYKYKGMPEVNMISLIRHNFDEEGKISEKFTSYAGVFTKFENYGDQGFIDSKTAEIENDQVQFVTNKIKGIEYRFNGAFFKSEAINEKVLRGTLQKFVKGKKVAEVSGEFEYNEPHCWH